MDTPRFTQRFKIVELAVVAVVLVALILLLLPALNARREAQRRASCINKVRQIGLGSGDYSTTFNNSFPGSAQLYETSATTSRVGGFSFLVKLLPFMEYDTMFRSLPQILTQGSVLASVNMPAPYGQVYKKQINASRKEFVCPSNPNPLYVNPRADPPEYALTNYKAMGASCKASLMLAADPSAPPPYGKAAIHPDGAIYPGAGSRAADITDGLSHTIFVSETIDDKASVWMMGEHCTLTGLPGEGAKFSPNSVPTTASPADRWGYHVPEYYDNTFGDASGVSTHGLRTFLTYVCSPSGAEANGYMEDGDPQFPLRDTVPGATQNYPAYGPSSAHPRVVIVGMGDGSTMALSRRVDAAAFFFLVTKSNSDPFNVP